MPNKILHIAGCDKFIPPFVELIKENFEFKQHEFLLTGGMAENNLIKASNVHLAKKTVAGRLGHYFKALIKMHQADKIILHGLFDIRMVFILFFTPWLLKKCYWLIWGGDLYAYQLAKRTWKWKVREFFRSTVIKRMGYFVTYTKGDYELAKKWYGASGSLIRCFYYTSNLYTPLQAVREKREAVYIMVGNSADPTNNHIEVFEKLSKFKDENIKVYAPLTYGNQEYARLVIDKGVKVFGDKFKPLVEHMSKDDYMYFLSQIDIAVFDHNRQQGMGNTRTLLGMGKKVYMRPHLTSTQTLQVDGVKTFTLKEFDLNYQFPESEGNINIIKSIFSKENLKKGLGEVFD